MTVKNVNQYHGATRDQLCVLSTYHLLQILESARARAVCSCARHCGDDVLTEDQLAWNAAQHELFTNVKSILDKRPNWTASVKRIPKQEKKAMRY
jgi:hypothetical protein